MLWAEPPPPLTLDRDSLEATLRRQAPPPGRDYILGSLRRLPPGPASIELRDAVERELHYAFRIDDDSLPAPAADADVSNPEHSNYPGPNRGLILRDHVFALVVQQAYRLSEAGVRAELEGPFFRDYWDSVTHVKQGFWDGDPLFWNVFAHPLQGGVSFYSARSRGASEPESFLWALASSTHWELGPIGQAGIGNNRLSPYDLVVTPVAGYLWVKLEDWADARIDRLPDGIEKKIWRSLLPARAFTNLIRGRAPWDRRPLE